MPKASGVGTPPIEPANCTQMSAPPAALVLPPKVGAAMENVAPVSLSSDGKGYQNSTFKRIRIW